MPGSITSATRARLVAAGVIPTERDLYSGAGTAFYERLVGSDRAEIREVLALAREATDPILDLAAGGGRLTIPLVRSGRRVTAVDLSDDMLAHLRHALPENPLLDCVVADMCELSLDDRFGLIVIGATSITLLDRAGRTRLYDSVRRHLAPGGTFALTVAGGASAAGLRVPREEEIRVPGDDGDEDYLFTQQIDDDGAIRTVNWVRIAELIPGERATVLTSRLHVLSHTVLARELVDAGFVAPVVAPVRTDTGEEILLLTTTLAGATEGADVHAPH